MDTHTVSETKFTASDGTEWIRTLTVAPISALKLRRVETYHLNTAASGIELVFAMRGALVAHQKYYEAGVLHSNVILGNVRFFREEGDFLREGVLLDLDPCLSYETPYMAGRKKEKGQTAGGAAGEESKAE